MNLISRKTIRIILMLSLPVLAACSGGGGGSSSSSSTSSYFGAVTSAGQWYPLESSGVNTVIMESHTKDLDNDGMDEVLVVGRQTDPQGGAHRSFNIQIFSWKNSSTLQNVTSDWFSGSDNVIIGSDQAVGFGDFDDDNRTDFVISASTDDSSRVTYSEAVVFRQTTSGSFTRSVPIGTAAKIWSHDALVHDFDGDGTDDFLTSDYYDAGNGSTLGITLAISQGDGTFVLHNATTGASGMSVADYVAGGQSEILLTDNGGTNAQDGHLYSYSFASGDANSTGTLTLTKISDLPATIDSTKDHSIRNFALDFDGDGDIDAVSINRKLSSPSTSELQFLANNGAGTFTDVTNDYLVDTRGSNNAAYSYLPQITDVNGDGLNDIIYISDDIGQARVLLQSNDATKKYVASWNNVFADFATRIKAATTSHSKTAQAGTIAKGPNSEYYLIGNVFVDDLVRSQIKTFSAKIGAKPSIATQSAAELQNNVWPY